MLGAAFVDWVAEGYAFMRREPAKVRRRVQIVDEEELVAVNVQQPIDITVGVRFAEAVLAMRSCRTSTWCSTAEMSSEPKRDAVCKDRHSLLSCELRDDSQSVVAVARALASRRNRLAKAMPASSGSSK